MALSSINAQLLSQPFLSGFKQPGQQDVDLFNSLKPEQVDPQALPNLHRWYQHLKTYSEMDLQKLSLDDKGPAEAGSNLTPEQKKTLITRNLQVTLHYRYMKHINLMIYRTANQMLNLSSALSSDCITYWCSTFALYHFFYNFYSLKIILKLTGLKKLLYIFFIDYNEYFWRLQPGIFCFNSKLSVSGVII